MDTDDEKDYYEILQVHPKADQEVIKKAFKALSHKYHPDKPGGNEATFKGVNEAYQVLSNPSKRAAHDAQRQAAATQKAAGGAQTRGGSTTGKNGSTQTPYSARPKKRPKQYHTSYSTTSSNAHTGSGYTANKTSGGSSARPSGPKTSTNPFLARWYPFVYYTGRGLAFIGQIFLGYIIFMFLGVVAVIIDFVLSIFGNKHFLTGTFTGLIIFSLMVVFSLFVANNAMGRPRYRKVGYTVGLLVLSAFLVTEGIPAAYRNMTGQIATTAMMNGIKQPVGANPVVPYENNMYATKEKLTYEQILLLQKALAKDSSIYPEGLTTGFYGELTHRALIRFQEKYGIPAQGRYDAETQKKIEEVFGMSTVVSQTQKTTQATVSAATPVAPKYLTIRFVNEAGVPYTVYGKAVYELNSVYITDEVGERIQGNFAGITNDRYRYQFNEVLPEKKYRLFWPSGDSYFETTLQGNKVTAYRYYDAGSQEIVYDKERMNAYDIVAPQTAQRIMGVYVVMHVINEVGTPVHISTSRLTVVNAADKRLGYFAEWESSVSSVSYYFRWVTQSAPGTYTLKITHPDYKEKTVTFTMPNIAGVHTNEITSLSRIDLGTIVLEK